MLKQVKQLFQSNKKYDSKPTVEPATGASEKQIASIDSELRNLIQQGENYSEMNIAAIATIYNNLYKLIQTEKVCFGEKSYKKIQETTNQVYRKISLKNDSLNFRSIPVQQFLVDKIRNELDKINLVTDSILGRTDSILGKNDQIEKDVSEMSKHGIENRDIITLLKQISANPAVSQQTSFNTLEKIKKMQQELNNRIKQLINKEMKVIDKLEEEINARGGSLTERLEQYKEVLEKVKKLYDIDQGFTTGRYLIQKTLQLLNNTYSSKEAKYYDTILEQALYTYENLPEDPADPKEHTLENAIEAQIERMNIFNNLGHYSLDNCGNTKSSLIRAHHCYQETMKTAQNLAENHDANQYQDSRKVNYLHMFRTSQQHVDKIADTLLQKHRYDVNNPEQPAPSKVSEQPEQSNTAVEQYVTPKVSEQSAKSSTEVEQYVTPKVSALYPSLTPNTKKPPQGGVKLPGMDPANGLVAQDNTHPTSGEHLGLDMFLEGLGVGPVVEILKTITDTPVPFARKVRPYNNASEIKEEDEPSTSNQASDESNRYAKIMEYLKPTDPYWENYVSDMHKKYSAGDHFTARNIQEKITDKLIPNVPSKEQIVQSFGNFLTASIKSHPEEHPYPLKDFKFGNPKLEQVYKGMDELSQHCADLLIEYAQVPQFWDVANVFGPTAAAFTFNPATVLGGEIAHLNLESCNE